MKVSIQKSIAEFARSKAFAPILLLSILLIVFWPEPNKEFLLWDDEAILSQYKPFLPVTWSTIPELATSTFTGEYMPITKAVWMLTILPMQWLADSRWSTENWVQPFIFVGILFHFLNCLLIKELLPVLFRNDADKKDWKDWIPVILYALHPLHVEGLAGISMFRETLWIFFGLLSVRAYLRSRLWRSFFLFLLATLSKPPAIIISGLVLLLQLIKYDFNNLSKKRVIFYFSALFSWSVFIGVLAKSIQPTQDFTTTLLERFIYSLDTFGFYLTKIIVPLNLAADYGRTYSWLRLQGWTSEIIVFSIFTFSLLILFWRRRQYRTKILISASIFLLPLIPVSGWIAFAMQDYGNVADHYATFSIIAWASLLYMLRRSDYRINFMLVLLCVFYGWQSIEQKKTWINNETFAMHTLKINPRSFMAYNNLGLHWLRQGKEDQALEAFGKSIDLNPKIPNPYFNSVYILNKRGNYNESMALLKGCQLHCPKSSELALSIANVLEEQGQTAEAIEIYNEAKKDFPGKPRVRYKLGLAYWKQNQYQQAIEELKTATELEPENSNFRELLKKSETLYEEIKKVN